MDLLKNLNISEKPKKISIKYTAKGFNFSVKKKVPSEVKDYSEKIKEMMEKEDYTFIK